MLSVRRSSFLAALAAATAAAAAPRTSAAADGGSPLWHVALFRFAPEHRGLATDAFRKMRDASRTHRGNLGYDVFASADDPGSFFIVERWASAAALAAHERTPIFNEIGRNVLNRYAEFHDSAERGHALSCSCCVPRRGSAPLHRGVSRLVGASRCSCREVE